MPGALLAALIDRFHWAEPISALNRFHPDLRARVTTRLAEAQAWLDDLHASARRLDDVGSAARLVLRPPSAAADLSRLTPGTLRALQGFVDAALRYGPLLGAAINQEGVERLERSSRAETPPIDALAHIGAATRLPEGARWALALSAMYTISQYGTDATLQPFLDAQHEQSLAILRDYWGITAESPEVRREQTIDRLTWLLNEGHRADPQCAEPGDPEAPVDLLAWDLARAAMTTRHAYLADCLTESEAWSYLLTIALKAQTSFESWRDYADRYRRGRIRWSNALYDRFDNILTFLIEDPHSPWRRLPWRLRLDETTVRGPSFDVAPRTLRRAADQRVATAWASPCRRWGGGASWRYWSSAGRGLPADETGAERPRRPSRQRSSSRRSPNRPRTPIRRVANSPASKCSLPPTTLAFAPISVTRPRSIRSAISATASTGQPLTARSAPSRSKRPTRACRRRSTRRPACIS